MSREAFGRSYADIKKLIYPRPRYRAFLLHKRRGGVRVIQEPYFKVKALQDKALAFLKKYGAEPKPCAHGFVDGRSTVTNARAHWEQQPRFVLNLDLQDFFPSITFYRVRGLLQKGPFNFSHGVATVLAHLCTLDGVLPQGAPTSPYIANLICRGLDRDLMALARRHRSTYTRYADDLTFSFSVRDASRLPSNLCTYDGGVLTIGEELKALIQSHSFRIHDGKTRISSVHSRQEVTGITINAFPNVPRKFVDKIRGGLHAWQRWGYAGAQAEWERRLKDPGSKGLSGKAWQRQTRTETPPRLSNLLWGRLLYLRMVRGKEDALYTRLAERYNALVDQAKVLDKTFRAPKLPVSAVVKGQDDIQRATYVVEWLGDAPRPDGQDTEVVSAQGTAFAYKRSDLLITCDHIFRFELQGASKDIADVPGAQLTVSMPSTGREWAATLVHRDVDRDLAVLQIAADLAGLRHFSGVEAPATRHQPAWLIGFPNWTPGRGVDVQRTAVTNAFARSGLRRLDTSALIRQGNSGGPLVDDSFRVIGVAEQGATQETGNNECLCATELDAWLMSSGAIA